MKRLLVLLLLFLPNLVSAQELHTFSNGEVADADKINDNFNQLKEALQVNSSCSVRQDGANAIISCGDSVATLYSAGTIVVGSPQGITGQVNDIFYAGTIVAKDANGTLLGRVTFQESTDNDQFQNFTLRIDEGATTSTGEVLTDGREIFVTNRYEWGGGNFEYGSVYGGVNRDIYFESQDCSGTPFYWDTQADEWMTHQIQGIKNFNAEGYESLFFASTGTQLSGNKLVGSVLINSSQCEAKPNTVIFYPTILAPYTLPEELMNAVFPVYLEQLP